MTHKENITAILECYFTGFKKEIIDSACNRILEQAETVTEFADRCRECGKMRKGHWILQSSNKDQGERNFIWWKCSECGQVIYSGAENDRREYHAFCGRCGAKMEDDIEPKTGHWIIMGDMYIKCSECGHITKTESPDIYNFCMVCGVKMSEDLPSVKPQEKNGQIDKQTLWNKAGTSNHITREDVNVRPPKDNSGTQVLNEGFAERSEE